MLGRIVNDYESLIEVCRERADELAISRSGIDVLSGCANGFAGKVLGHRQAKKMGPLTLGPMLQGSLGLKLLIIEDEAATQRSTLALRTPVQANQQRLRQCVTPHAETAAASPLLTIVNGGRKRGVTKYG